MTTNWQQPPGGPPATQPDPRGSKQPRGKRVGVVAALLVVIAGLAAGAGLFIVNRDADTGGDNARYVLTETVANEPVFQERDARGPDPFFPLEVQLVAFQEEEEQEVRDQAEELLEDAEPGQEVDVPEFDVAALDTAVRTGLYGGTEENTCDPERLISFLYANPILGEAWALVQAIEFSEIADYIRSLEVRILAAPTNVLNHGFDAESGAPYEIDSILDAGTAVLVDEKGDVRTRCYCGNPIKPKPPEHMPPRCVVWIEHVYVEPGEEKRRESAIRDVLLTRRETSVGGAKWIEVKWGNADEQHGWVRSDNLRKHYCPPEDIEWHCPGPDAVPVWAEPNEDEQVGWHTGIVKTEGGGSAEIFGPVEPVGFPTETIINNFMLIHFTPAGPSGQHSAWVRIADLNQDKENCYRIPACVDTKGPVLSRAHTWNQVSPGGVMRVEFTGRFVTGLIISRSEVRLLEQGGVAGWISPLYTVLPDEDCDRPVYECVTDHGGLGSIVWNTSTEAGPSHLGHIYNAIVTVTGAAQDGRVPVQMATPGGPDGWVDESNFVADFARCEPIYECYITTGPAYTEYPTNGAMIPAQPVPSIIGKIGKSVDATPGDPVSYERIEVAGVRYWIDYDHLIPVAPQDCGPTDVNCPSYTTPLYGRDGVPRIDEQIHVDAEGGVHPIDPVNDGGQADRPAISACCVSALYETPDTGTPVIGLPFPLQVTVVDSISVDNGVGPETWFVTGGGDYFMATHVVFASDCLGDCPAPILVPLAADVLATEVPAEMLQRIEEPRVYDRTPGPSEDCCISGAYTATDAAIGAAGPWPRLVDVVSGPHAPAPGWYLTADGAWFTTTQVLPNSLCEMVSCPNPMTPGRYDLAGLRRTTEERPVLTVMYGGDSAECCADGEIYGGPSEADLTGGVLTEPTSVIVVAIEGDWYQVIIQDFVAWIHVSQFLDLADCDPPQSECTDVAQDLTRLDDGRHELQVSAVCCFEGRVRTVTPAEAGPGDWATIDPTSGEIVALVIVDNVQWFEVETEPHGTVWANATNFADPASCERTAECPGDSLVGVAVADDFENGVSFNVYSCCVAFNSAAAGPGFRVVTLTGETQEVAGVVSYETTDGDFIIETDFVNADRCNEVTCPDGQTVVLDLEDCPPPGFTCEGGQTVPTPSDCPPTGFTCPTGQVVADRSQCPATPQSCDDTDGDGVCDVDDNCVFNANPGQEDFDLDGRGDRCDDCPAGDFDGDTICDGQDNCPETPNIDQSDRDRDNIGDVCDAPDCPKDRVLNSGQCCPEGSSADGTECFCQSGPEVLPGGTCPPPCPRAQQLIGGGCCPAQSTAGTAGCFCPDQSLTTPGVPCTHECPGGNRLPLDEDCPPLVSGLTLACPSERVLPDGCCPVGTVASQLFTSSAVIFQCVEP